MTSIMSPICMACAHYRREAPGLTCDAYPDGIPDAILDSDVDHRKPYTGDHGIQFEVNTAMDTAMVAQFLQTHDEILHIGEGKA